jgi:hypothetical protein
MAHLRFLWYLATLSLLRFLFVKSYTNRISFLGHATLQGPDYIR